MADLRIHVVVGPRALAGLAAGALLLGTASELASESLVLTTYYPAPSATYGQLVTTGNAILARDGGGVTIGANSAGSAKLAVMNGAVGIGTTRPMAALHVEGNQTFSEDVSVDSVRGVSWHYSASWANGSLYYGIAREPGAWVWPYPDLSIDFHTGLKLKADGRYGGTSFWEEWYDGNVDVNGAGGTGFGTEVARFRANYWGGTSIRSNFALGATTAETQLDVRGDGVGIFRQPASRCYTRSYTIGAGAYVYNCRAGEYATNQSGVMSRYGAAQAGSGGQVGSFLCCQCPFSSCPSIP